MSNELDWLGDASDYGLDEESDRIVKQVCVPIERLNLPEWWHVGDIIAIGSEQLAIVDFEDNTLTLERLDDEDRTASPLCSREAMQISNGSVHICIG